jgi:predicted RNase H-like HicB family nuclease
MAIISETGATKMSKSKKYNITLGWNEEQHIYIAQADDIPGVIGKGKTREDALVALQDAIRWWLETATEGTVPPSSPDAPDPQLQQ